MFKSVGLPHGFCFLWNPQLLWLHVLSDSTIALAYFLIPLALIRIVRQRKDIPFNGIFFCFSTFIVACGLTHVMEVLTLWQPVLYWISGGLKALTAVVSMATFILLIRLTPAILAIPHERDLARVNQELNSVLGKHNDVRARDGLELEDHLSEQQRAAPARGGQRDQRHDAVGGVSRAAAGDARAAGAGDGDTRAGRVRGLLRATRSLDQRACASLRKRRG